MYIQYLYNSGNNNRYGAETKFRHKEGRRMRGRETVSTAGIATSSIDFERGTKRTLLVALTILDSENGDCCGGKGVCCGGNMAREHLEQWIKLYNKRYWMNWYWYRSALCPAKTKIEKAKKKLKIVSIETSFDVVVNTCWPGRKSCCQLALARHINSQMPKAEPETQ